MRVTRISVALEKRASDGDYGSERAEAEMSADLEPSDEPVVCLEALQMQLRHRVEQDLLQSPNLRVRRAMIRQDRRCSRCHELLADTETGYLHEACDQAERAEREARYQARRREIEQEESPESGDAVIDGREASDHGTDDQDREALHAGVQDDPF